MHLIFKYVGDGLMFTFLFKYWSSELETAAQTWANGCRWGHGYPNLSENKFQPLGQNIYGGGKACVKLIFIERRELKQNHEIKLELNFNN